MTPTDCMSVGGCRSSPSCSRSISKDARVDGTGTTDVGRLIRGEFVPEGVEDVAVPDLLHTLFEHVAHVGPVGRGDHAAGHGVAGVADVAAAPRPAAPLAAGRPRRVGPRLGAWQ